MRKKIGLIGFGNMGSAIFARASDSFDFLVYEKDASKTAGLPPERVERDLRKLVQSVSAVVLAVKPQDLSGLFPLMGAVDRAAVFSIAAGITTAAIEREIPGARVIRVMPNLPARVGRGMACISRGKKALPPDLSLAEQLFKKTGKVMVIDESLMDAATAVSGSGPGFFFDRVSGQSVHEAENYGKHVFAEELKEAAMAVGFAPPQAAVLARAATEGAVELLKELKVPAAALRDQVTSKGGTTEAGLKALHETNSLSDACKAALARARELSQ